MVTSQASGHPIYFDGTTWRFVDSGEVLNHERACSACGRECVTLEIGGKRVGVDACIAPIVRALNTVGVATIASCCGHTHRPGAIVLADRREIRILANFEEAQRVDNVFPRDIHGQKRPRPSAPLVLREGETPCPDCGGGFANLHVNCTSGPRFSSRPRRSIWQRLIARFRRENAVVPPGGYPPLPDPLPPMPAPPPPPPNRMVRKP